MKRLFSLTDLSIKHKLIRIYMLTTGSALLLAGMVFITTELVSLRYGIVHNLSGFAETMASNVKAALAFSDRKSAEETLSSLSAVPTITFAAVRDSKGQVFAIYQRGDRPSPSDTPSLKPGTHHFGLTYVDVCRQITLDNDAIGTVTIRSELNFFYSRMILYIAILLLVLGLALSLSYLMLAKLQLLVTRPISELAQLMRTIPEERDYSLRAKVGGKDEIGLLAEGFNEMLANIQARDEELEGYRRHLEDLVQDRTVQLREANLRLQKELAERLRIQDALAESEHRYRTIFETTGNASLILEEDTTISLVNTAFEELSGYRKEEVEGKKSWTEFVAAEDLDRMRTYHNLRRSGSEGVPNSYEACFVNREGKVHEVYFSVAVIPGTRKSVCSILDLTELKRLEDQLRQSQKMEAVGRLAGGVAHDFNNILTAIIGYASLARMQMDSNDPLKNYIDSVLSSAERAAHLTTGLLAFSRKQVIAPKVLDLNDVIKHVEHILRRIIGEDIDLKTAYPEDPITILADRGQLDQVLINLATNARDAMPDGGRLTIRTKTVFMDQMMAERPSYLKPGSYALVTVSDTGVGISKEVIDRIFEPFFTTKEVGKGTGLGLSIVYGIIKQHSGYIAASSEPGSGTMFSVYLPLSKQEKTDESTGRIARTEAPVGGRETLLVAEDDPVTRALIKEVLQKHGYSVLEAVDGDEAIRRFEERKEEIHLVLLDVIMPKKNGRQAYEEIKKMKPAIEALFLSGYTADIVHKKGIFEEDINFLSKPVSPEDLLRKVRELLDS